MNTKKPPFSERTDREKLETNWGKTMKLMDRREYSGAIVRAATCAEIAINIVIRQELINEKSLDEKFVESLMIWANGIQGKLQRIVLPYFKGTVREADFTQLQDQIRELNQKRNAIIHSGYFASSETAITNLKRARKICLKLVKHYEDDFTLQEPRQPVE